MFCLTTQTFAYAVICVAREACGRRRFSSKSCGTVSKTRSVLRYYCLTVATPTATTMDPLGKTDEKLFCCNHHTNIHQKQKGIIP